MSGEKPDAREEFLTLGRGIRDFILADLKWAFSGAILGAVIVGLGASLVLDQDFSSAAKIGIVAGALGGVFLRAILKVPFDFERKKPGDRSDN